jgi:hypothetical protein
VDGSETGIRTDSARGRSARALAVAVSVPAVGRRWRCLPFALALASVSVVAFGFSHFVALTVYAMPTTDAALRP